MRFSSLMLAAGAALALSGCGQSNPIIGEWEIHISDPSTKAMIGMVPDAARSMTFEGDKMKAGGQEIKVAYEVVDHKTVVVKVSGEPDTRIAIETVDGRECLKMPGGMEMLGARFCKKA